ncbi:MAG TPA: SdpI family protein [Clostridiales bacterium]|nr:SdpI family protein [Clostridiales bacterium]
MKKIEYNLKRELPLILIIILSFAISIYFYPMMPDRVPTHWNFRGEIDGYSGKFSGTFMMPIMSLIMYGLFLVLPVLDPKKNNYERFKSTYVFFRYLFHIFFLGMQTMIILAALGYKVDISRWVMFSISLLFMLMGNVMGRVKHNYFVGIRTPWTLASEEVWVKTHRMAAILWTVGGFIGAVLSLLKIGLAWILVTIAFIPTLIPVVYSYLLFNKISKTKNSDS